VRFNKRVRVKLKHHNILYKYPLIDNYTKKSNILLFSVNQLIFLGKLLLVLVIKIFHYSPEFSTTASILMQAKVPYQTWNALPIQVVQDFIIFFMIRFEFLGICD